MSPAQKKPVDELRMSGKEFDRIMGQALQVKPQAEKKPKKPKAKSSRKTTK